MYTFNVKQQASQLVLVVFATIFAMAAQAKSLTASIDRNVVSQLDTFTLQVEAQDIASLTSPDFSRLDNDFVVLSKNVNHKIQTVNGVSSQSVVWQLRLRAKKLGKTVIPAFNLAGETSKQIDLDVEKPVLSTSDNSDFKLELVANKTSAVVGEQIIFTEKFLFSKNINNPRISEFLIANAHVIRLDDKNYESDIDGKRYGVYEIRYAVFPTTVGPLQIPSQQLSANLGRQTIYGSQTSKSISLQSEPLTIAVTDVPLSKGSAVKSVLVADNVELSQVWSQGSESITLGDSITREIGLKVSGAQAYSISPLSMSEIDDIKIYPEVALKSEQKSNEGIIIERSRKFAIVPTKAGSYLIPAIKISWWNSQAKQVQQAVLEEKLIEVKAPLASDQQVPVIPVAIKTVQKDKGLEPSNLHQAKSEKPKTIVEKVMVEKPVNTLLLISTIILSVLVMVLAFLLKKSSVRFAGQRATKSRVIGPGLASQAQEKQLFDALMQTLATDSNSTIALAFQRWVNHNQINGLLSAALQQNVMTLERSLYAAKPDETWDKNSFTQLVKAFRQEFLSTANSIKNKQTSLAALYPTSLKEAG